MGKIIRPLFYIIILVISVIAVEKHKTTITNNKNEDTKSVLSIWQDKGVPVVTYTVTAQDLTENIQVSLQECGTRKCFYQSSDKSKYLSHGDPVYSIEDGKTIGQIVSVSGTNSFTGLVKAYVKMTQKFEPHTKESKFSIVSVGVRKLSQVLAVPILSLGYNKDSGFVWLYNNGKPKKKNIKLGARSSDMAEVRNGLSSGDVIVYQGQGLLNIYDKARTIGTTNKNSKNLNLN